MTKDLINRADALAAIALGDTVNQLQAKILAIPAAALPAATAQAAQIAGLRQAMTDADNDVILAHEARKEAEAKAAALRERVARLEGVMHNKENKP